MVSEEQAERSTSGHWWRGGSPVGDSIYCNLFLYKTSHSRVPDRNPESGTRGTGRVGREPEKPLGAPPARARPRAAVPCAVRGDHPGAQDDI